MELVKKNSRKNIKLFLANNVPGVQNPHVITIQKNSKLFNPDRTCRMIEKAPEMEEFIKDMMKSTENESIFNRLLKILKDKWTRKKLYAILNYIEHGDKEESQQELFNKFTKLMYKEARRIGIIGKDIVWPPEIKRD